MSKKEKRQKRLKEKEIKKLLEQKLENIKKFTDYERGIKIYEK